MSYGELLNIYTEVYTGGCSITSKTREGITKEIKSIFGIDDDEDVISHENFINLLVEYHNDKESKEKKKKNYDKRKNAEIKQLQEKVEFHKKKRQEQAEEWEKLKQENQQLKKMLDKQHQELKEIKTKVNNLINM